MSEKVFVRQAKESDARGIGLVHSLSWQETYKGIIPQDYLDSIDPEKRISFWQKNLSDNSKRSEVWVAESKSGQVLGFCCGGGPRQQELGFDCELYAIYLLKQYHGKGIGKSLFNSLTAKLRSEGKKSMYLWVIKESQTCSIYRSFGGVESGHSKMENIGGKEVEEVVFSFNLS